MTYGLTNVTESLALGEPTQESTELTTLETTLQVQKETETTLMHTTNIYFTDKSTEKETVVTEITVTSDTLELTNESSQKTDKYLTTSLTTQVSDISNRSETTKSGDAVTELKETVTVYMTEGMEPRSSVTTVPTKQSTLKIPSGSSTTQLEVTEEVETTDGGEFQVTTEQLDTSTVSEIDCSKTICLNGGTCHFTMSGPRVYIYQNK